MGGYEIILFSRSGSPEIISDNSILVHFDKTFENGDFVIFMPMAFNDDESIDIGRMKATITTGGYCPLTVSAGTNSATFLCPNPKEYAILIGGFIFRPHTPTHTGVMSIGGFFTNTGA